MPKLSAKGVVTPVLADRLAIIDDVGGADNVRLATGTAWRDLFQANLTSVTITGGSISGITDLAIADGGTGASTATAAFDALKQAATTTATGVVEIATTAEYRAQTAGKALDTDVWDAAAEVTLTDAVTIAVDMSTFLNATVTLGGNRTLGNPTNPKVGQTGVIRVVQDATGSRTLAYAANYEFAGGAAPTLSTAANAEDLLFYHVISATRIFVSSALNIS